MKTPTEYDIERLMHFAAYDPAKAHQYYEKHKRLKGRKRGTAQENRKSRHVSHRNQQKKKLAEAIQSLETKLHKLEATIRQKEHAEASENRKAKAKKERAAKENTKPKSAAEKAKAARANEKFRKKNQGVLKSKAKRNAAKSGGGSSTGKTGSASSSKHAVTELKSLATRVKGQIAIAKVKLAAL